MNHTYNKDLFKKYSYLVKKEHEMHKEIDLFGKKGDYFFLHDAFTRIEKMMVVDFGGNNQDWEELKTVFFHARKGTITGQMIRWQLKEQIK